MVAKWLYDILFGSALVLAAGGFGVLRFRRPASPRGRRIAALAIVVGVIGAVLLARSSGDVVVVTDAGFARRVRLGAVSYRLARGESQLTFRPG